MKLFFANMKTNSHFQNFSVPERFTANSRTLMSNTRNFSAFARTVFTVLALAGFVLAPRAFAQGNANPPERLAYQGYLVDGNGNALATNAPKNYDVIFRIWNDSSVTAATNRLWTEQQTVTVDKGYFSVILGEGSSIGEAHQVAPERPKALPSHHRQ